LLRQISLHFTGELWRQAAVQKLVTCGYTVDLSGTNGFSTNLTATLTNLTVSFAPDTSLTNPVPVNGTANQIPLEITNQPIVNWPPGAALWLVWQIADPTGKGQGLAIDDLTFSAIGGQVLVPVTLTIQQTGSNVVLSWPAAAMGSVLQATSDPASSNTWSVVTQPIVVTNGFNTVTLPTLGTAQFYRIKE